MVAYHAKNDDIKGLFQGSPIERLRATEIV